MKIISLILGVFCCVAPSLADTVIAGGLTTCTGGTCGGGVTGSITANSVSISSSVGVAVSSVQQPGGSAYAATSGAGSLLLETPGPLRSGYIVFTGSWSQSRDINSDGSGSISVGYWSENCSTSGLAVPLLCTGNLADQASCGAAGCFPAGPTPQTLQFSLGREFTVSASFQAEAGAYTPNFPTGSYSGGLSLSYYLTELDGTPVQPFIVSDVPEPGSGLLLVTGILGLCFLLKTASARNRA